MPRFLQISTVLLGFVISTQAQWLNYPSPGTPRTKDGKPDLLAKAPRLGGKPDLSGIWQVEVSSKEKEEIKRMLGANAALEVPGDDLTTFSKYFFNILADFPSEESVISPVAAEIMRNRAKTATLPDSKCLPVGVPRAELIGFPFKIVQTLGLTVMLYEADNTRRQIYTDGRKLPTDPNPAWLGYSVGRWDGDTLVVDSAGFNEKFWIDTFGHPVSSALKIEERFHRRDFGHMDLQVTITDPKMFSRPIVVKVTESLIPDSDILEYFCTENEKDQAHIARAN